MRCSFYYRKNETKEINNYTSLNLNLQNYTGNALQIQK